MNPRRIVIDGKVYNSVDEMPADIRQRYEQAMSSLKDQNGNGVPDVLENSGLADNNRNGIPDIIENTPGAPIFAKAMKILLNGQEFNNIDQLPPEVRAKYEQAMQKLDANHDGIPDMLADSTNAPVIKTSMKFQVNGKEVNSLNDLPPEARARYEQVMGKLDTNQNGIPDFMENMQAAQQTPAPVSTTFGIEPPSSSSIPSALPVTPTITPDTTNGWMLALLGVVVLMMCAAGAAGIWYFFLR